MRTLCWFRQDLRTADNPALAYAATQGEVIPVFILDDTDRSPGGASRWWLHYSLSALRQQLGGIVFMRGDPESILQQLASDFQACSVVWNRSYEPHAISRDRTIKENLKKNGVAVKSFPGSIIREPWELQTGAGNPYKVYTPFWKALKSRGYPPPLPVAKPKVPAIPDIGLQLDELELLPKNPDWASEWKTLWTPGEAGASGALDAFLENGVAGYDVLRDRPDLPNVSRLSPHIHFGEISPRQICAKAQFFADQTPDLSNHITKFLSEVAWRDFAVHLLYHFPDIPTQNWKPAFDAYPWAEDANGLTAWQKGNTGYPIVDAGMRELWQTGYMHNRVRMVAASFLVKHLRIHWRAGEAWFWDTLLDADLANNSAGWQWVAGSGADASPYFRVFNPISQGRKFDPDGTYVRRWCPELSKLPNTFIHAPFEATPMELQAAGITLGKTYPAPIVDHKSARQAALEGYASVKLAQAGQE